MGDRVKVKMRGYKAFNADLTCHSDFKYEIGKEYKMEGKIKLCVSGFHFCRDAEDCLDYYNIHQKKIRFCKVEALGRVLKSNNKCCTDHIRIVEEVPLPEIMSMCNNGRDCFGRDNYGDRNIGDGNYGCANTGDYNTGNHNSGSRNAGSYNVGYYNTGNGNVGKFNTGSWNVGSYNAGLLNRGNYNCGIFCFGDNWGYEYIFNRPLAEDSSASGRTVSDYMRRLYRMMMEVRQPTIFLTRDDLDEARYFGIGHNNCWEADIISIIGAGTTVVDVPILWAEILKDEKLRELIVTLPNYNDTIFREITGVSILKT